jgi:2-hydroxychromene-2-carboxylate isomerase
LTPGLALKIPTVMPAIRFYFDYESPNAYLAWKQLPALASRHGFTVEPVPILYAALLDAHGQLGPGEQPTKGRWMGKNLLRKAALLGVPLNPPAFLPFNPLLALRMTMLPPEADRRRALIGALFEAVWVRGLHVGEAAVVEGVADEIGLPGAALVAEAQTPEIKSQLRAQTEEAIAKGVFGVPSMIVGDELFWGYDDFPYLELFLAGKDPLDAEAWQRWSRPVRASSVRRRFRSNENA